MGSHRSDLQMPVIVLQGFVWVVMFCILKPPYVFINVYITCINYLWLLSEFVLCCSLQDATESTTGHHCQLVWIAVLWQSDGLSQSTQRGVYQGWCTFTWKWKQVWFLFSKRCEIMCVSWSMRPFLNKLCGVTNVVWVCSWPVKASYHTLLLQSKFEFMVVKSSYCDIMYPHWKRSQCTRACCFTGRPTWWVSGYAF